MKGDLILPGRKRGTDVQVAVVIDELHELYLEYHHTACSPFKMLRLDRYFYALEETAAVIMRPAKGGKEWDNRKRAK